MADAGSPRMGRPKVSVCVVSYNQAAYIRQTLDSLLEQDCAFPYEVIVSDDASRDGTADIVRSYAERHPGRVVALLQKANLGPTQNYFAVHGHARGEYIAHMDGDDLAYPSKLRRQAELLDAHPECSMATHDVDIIDREGRRSGASYMTGHPLFAPVEYLVKTGGYFVASSKMYRRSATMAPVPPGKEVVDLYMHIEQASHGPIAWLPDRLGAYRRMVGVTSSIVDADRLAEAQRAAVDHAEDLGCDPRAVAKGRLRVERSVAVLKAIRGDHEAFARLIRLRPAQYRHATWKHIVLSLVRNRPALVRRLVARRARALASPAGRTPR